MSDEATMGASAPEPPKAMAEPAHYPSFAALRIAHGELLERSDDATPDDATYWANVMRFLRQARATGALIDDRRDRRAAYSILNFWSSKLYEAGYVPPEIGLVPFDEELAPSLDDVEPPYVGLAAFDDETHDRYFGREVMVQKLLELLRVRRLAAVVGASGSGKSSLVLGGVLPVLKKGALTGSDGWRYLPRLVPGSRPLYNLATLFLPEEMEEDGDEAWLESQQRQLWADEHHLAKLAAQRSPQPIVLFVDQFEELFTLVDNPATETAEWQAFTANLLNFVDAPGRKDALILTMRSDYRHNLLRLPDFNKRFKESELDMEALDINQLRAVIQGPAEKVGLKFDEGVVDDLIEDVLGEPAALPLLQFTLWQLWQKRWRNRITRESYEELGGAKKALETRADAFIENLKREDQEAARHIFSCLVTLNRNLEVTSKRVRRSELYHEGGADVRINEVLQRLSNERLVRLTPGGTAEKPCPADDQVEVAHEALIRNWPRLTEWLADDFERMRQRNNLTSQARHWQRARATAGEDETGLLWGEGALAAVQGYQDLTADERAFIRASEAAIEARQMREREAAEREKLLLSAKLAAETQRAEQRKRAAVLLSLALVAAVILAFFALGQRRDALDAQATSAVNEQLAVEKVVVAITAEAIAAENANLAGTRQTQALAAQAKSDASARREATAAAVAADAAAEARESERLAQAGRLAVLSLGAGISDKALLLSIRALEMLPDSPDARKAFLNALESDTHYPKTTTDVVGQYYYANGPYDLSGDGRLAAAANVDTEDGYLLLVWDTTSGEPLWELPQDELGYVTELALDRTGHILVTALDGGRLILHDLQASSQPRTLAARSTNEFTSLALSPDGSALASAETNGRVSLWQLGATSPISTMLPLTDTLSLGASLPQTLTQALEQYTFATSLAFSPDGGTLAVGGRNGEVMFWNIAGASLEPSFLNPTSAAVTALAYSGDGRRVVAGDDTGGLRVLTPGAPSPLYNLSTGGQPATMIALSEHGERMVSDGPANNLITLWDLSGEEAQRQWLRAARDRGVVGFTGSDRFLLAGQVPSSESVSGIALSAIRWDLSDAIFLRHKLGAHRVAASTLSRSENGIFLASGGCAAEVEEAGSELKEGQDVQSGCTEGEILLWQLTPAPALKHRLTGHGASIRDLALSADGQALVSLGSDGSLILWHDLASDDPHGRSLDIGADLSARNALFDPTGDGFFLGTESGLYQLSDINSGDIERRRLSPEQPLSITALDSDEQYLAAGDESGQIFLWPLADIATLGTQPLTYHLPVTVTALALHPSQPLLAAGAHDGTITLWNRCGGHSVVETIFAYRRLNGLAFSPDGSLLAAATNSDELLLWQVDVARDSCRMSVQVLGAPPEDVLFVPPTSRGPGVVDLTFLPSAPAQLAALHADGRFVLWEMETEAWKAFGCEVAGRNLTLQEWEEAFSGNDFLTDYTERTCPMHPVHPSFVQAAMEVAELEARMGQQQSGAYAKAVSWVAEISDWELHEALCRSGAIYGAAAAVAESCESAIQLAPDEGAPYDSRALARARMGYLDGAIADFAEFVSWTEADALRATLWRPAREQRREWMSRLEQNDNPFAGAGPLTGAALSAFQPPDPDNAYVLFDEAAALAERGETTAANEHYHEAAVVASRLTGGRPSSLEELLWLNGRICDEGASANADVRVACDRAIELASAFPDRSRPLFEICSSSGQTSDHGAACAIVEEIVPQVEESDLLYSTCTDAFASEALGLADIVCPTAIERAELEQEPEEIDLIAQSASTACRSSTSTKATAICREALALLEQSSFAGDAANYYEICRDGTVQGLAEAILPACEEAVALDGQDPLYGAALALAEARAANSRGENASAAYAAVARGAATLPDLYFQFDVCTSGIADGYESAVEPACDAFPAVEAGVWLRDTIENGNTPDYWLFRAEPGDQVTISMEADNDSSLDTYLTLLAADGTEAGRDDDGGTGYNSLLTFTVEEPGIYWILAGSYGLSTGAYRLLVTVSGN